MRDDSGRLDSWWFQQSVDMRAALRSLTTGDPLPADLYWPSLIQALPRGESVHGSQPGALVVPPALAHLLADRRAAW